MCIRDSTHDPRELAGLVDELQADDRRDDAGAAGALKRLHGRLGPIDDETENAVLPRVGGGEAAHGNAGALEEVELSLIHI